VAAILRKFGPKRRLAMDAVFAIALAILFWAMYSNLQTIRPEVGASYALLGLGALIFYLVAGMNYRFASLTHVGTFPFLSIFYLFGKWMPDAITKLQGEEVAFSLGILVHVLILVAFLVSHLLLHLNEPEPERVRQFKRVAL